MQSHQRITTVSLETYPIYLLLNTLRSVVYHICVLDMVPSITYNISSCRNCSFLFGWSEVNIIRLITLEQANHAARVESDHHFCSEAS